MRGRDEAVAVVERALVAVADVGEVERGGAAASEQRGAGGGAVGVGGVALREAHAGGGEAFDVGGLVKVAFGVGDLRVVEGGGGSPSLVVC